MSPFELGVLPPAAVAAQRASLEAQGLPPEHIEDILARAAGDAIWLNETYQVVVRNEGVPTEDWPAMISLSIKRRDRAPIHDWRELQQIKNMILGPEHEAVELYPKESRLVDTANQYWLWAMQDARYSFPFGFTERLVLGPDDGADIAPGSVQRPFGTIAP